MSMSAALLTVHTNRPVMPSHLLQMELSNHLDLQVSHVLVYCRHRVIHVLPKDPLGELPGRALAHRAALMSLQRAAANKDGFW